MPELFDIITKDVATGDATDVGTVFEELATLTTPFRDAGRYDLQNGFVHTLPNVTNQMEWYIEVDGVPSPTFSVEQSDTTEFFPLYYGYELPPWTGGVFEAKFFARKTGGADQLDFSSINLTFVRVG